jgi:integrase
MVATLIPINRHEQLSDKRLTDFAVAVIIKRAAKKAGLPTPQLSGHSLRAGFVTEAKKNGADDAAIMDQTGHKSLAMVHRYHRRTKKWVKAGEREAGAVSITHRKLPSREQRPSPAALLCSCSH